MNHNQVVHYSIRGATSSARLCVAQHHSLFSTTSSTVVRLAGRWSLLTSTRSCLWCIIGTCCFLNNLAQSDDFLPKSMPQQIKVMGTRTRIC